MVIDKVPAVGDAPTKAQAKEPVRRLDVPLETHVHAPVSALAAVTELTQVVPPDLDPTESINNAPGVGVKDPEVNDEAVVLLAAELKELTVQTVGPAELNLNESITIMAVQTPAHR